MNVRRFGNSAESLFEETWYLDSSPTAKAVQHLTAMSSALDQAEFRIFGLAPDPKEAAEIRRERAIQYRRHRELFLLELRVCRKLRRHAMALSEDWAAMGDYTRETWELAVAAVMLFVAGWMYRARWPGAQEVCETAAYKLFKLIYAPVKKARASASSFWDGFS